MLPGTNTALQRPEMLAVYRYLRGVTDEGMNGMVFSCPGNKNAILVQMAIICAIRLSMLAGRSFERLPLAASVDRICTHGDPFGIQCSCRPDSLTWKIYNRFPASPFVLLVRREDMASMAKCMDDYFSLIKREGDEQDTTMFTLAYPGDKTDHIFNIRTKEAILSLPMWETPADTDADTDTSRYIVVADQHRTMHFLTGRGPLEDVWWTTRPLLRASYIYIHDWTPGACFKPEVLLQAIIEAGRLDRRSGRRAAFSLTTPMVAEDAPDSIRAVAMLCNPQLARDSPPSSWMVNQGVTFRPPGTVANDVLQIRARVLAVTQATSREGDAPSDAPSDGLMAELSNLGHNAQPGLATTAGLGYGAVFRCSEAGRLRSLGLLPSLEPMWSRLRLRVLRGLARGWGDAVPEAPVENGEQQLDEACRQMRSALLVELRNLVIDLRDRTGGELEAVMALLVPDIILAQALTTWLSANLAEYCRVLQLQRDGDNAHTRARTASETLERARISLVRERQMEGNEDHTRILLLVVPPGGLNGYWNEFQYINSIVCVGDRWAAWEVDSVISVICQNLNDTYLKVIKVIRIITNTDPINSLK